MRLVPLAKTCSGGDFSPQSRQHEQVCKAASATLSTNVRACDQFETTSDCERVPFYRFLGVVQAQRRAAEQMLVHNELMQGCGDEANRTSVSVSERVTHRERETCVRVDVVTKYVAVTRTAVARRGLIDVVV